MRGHLRGDLRQFGVLFGQGAGLADLGGDLAGALDQPGPLARPGWGTPSAVVQVLAVAGTARAGDLGPQLGQAAQGGLRDVGAAARGAAGHDRVDVCRVVAG